MGLRAVGFVASVCAGVIFVEGPFQLWSVVHLREVVAVEEVVVHEEDHLHEVVFLDAGVHPLLPMVHLLEVVVRIVVVLQHTGRFPEDVVPVALRIESVVHRREVAVFDEATVLAEVLLHEVVMLDMVVHRGEGFH